MWVDEILSDIRDVEFIAAGRGVDVRKRLVAEYGGQRWRKMKGVAVIRDIRGEVYEAEIHWFEAHGVGKVEVRVRRNLWA
jgi:hypothetical protein